MRIRRNKRESKLIKYNIMEKKKFMRVQKFLILFLILLLSFPLSALAQQQMIKGQVVDDKGETIIGATVMVKGSKDGTLTDIDGNFSVKGKVGNTLVISYVGFTPLEIKVTKAEGNRFTLKEDTKVLDEVVVVGMDIDHVTEAQKQIVRIMKDNKLLNEDIKGIDIDLNF